MIVNIKKLNDLAIIPQYSNSTDAGLDLTAITKELDIANNVVVYGTGLALEIPVGYVGLIFPRSSIYKMHQSLSNCVGVIDSGYRGEIMFKFRLVELSRNQYSIGDRVGQLIILPYPQVTFELVEELSDSDRGNQGFGSTGN